MRRVLGPRTEPFNRGVDPRLPYRREDTIFRTYTHWKWPMPLNIRDEEVNRLADLLATRQRVTKTHAVKQALRNELIRLDSALPLRDRLRPLRERVLARPATGLDADKAFYDDLSGEQ
jgi:antitoxin VapB